MMMTVGVVVVYRVDSCRVVYSVIASFRRMLRPKNDLTVREVTHDLWYWWLSSWYHLFMSLFLFFWSTVYTLMSFVWIDLFCEINHYHIIISFGWRWWYWYWYWYWSISQNQIHSYLIVTLLNGITVPHHITQLTMIRYDMRLSINTHYSNTVAVVIPSKGWCCEFATSVNEKCLPALYTVHSAFPLYSYTVP